MKGTRPLDNDEIRLVSACFDGTFEARNRGLFMLGVSTGGRISELLSLQIGDVWQNGSAVTDLLFDKSIVKGGEVSRAVPVNRDGRLAIDALVAWHAEQYQNTQAMRSVFLTSPIIELTFSPSLRSVPSPMSQASKTSSKPKHPSTTTIAMRYGEQTLNTRNMNVSSE